MQEPEEKNHNKKEMQEVRNVLQVKTNTVTGCLIGRVLMLISLQWLQVSYILQLSNIFEFLVFFGV